MHTVQSEKIPTGIVWSVAPEPSENSARSEVEEKTVREDVKFISGTRYNK